MTLDIKKARELIVNHADKTDLLTAIKEWANCQKADVDSDGNIWIEGPQTGHWLKDEKIFDFVVWANLNS